MSCIGREHAQFRTLGYLNNLECHPNIVGPRRRESDTLSPGNKITTVETPFGVIGVGICYDMRFPELSMAMRVAGSVLLCFPGAFNMTTGPAHWELLQRARALDNQVLVPSARLHCYREFVTLDSDAFRDLWSLSSAFRLRPVKPQVRLRR